MSANTTLYDTDFHAWTNEQAALLRAGRVAELDIENLAEEIEGMSRSEKRELVSRLSQLLLHLLKWRYQPGLRGNSWRFTIRGQRDEVREHLDENPSLTAYLDAAWRSAYRKGRRAAVQETGLGPDTFPDESPFAFDQAMDPDFWPD